MSAPTETKKEWDHVMLADSFASRLRQALGDDDYFAVLALNSRDRDMRICHSHDFIDANEVMAEAFAAVTGRVMDCESDTDAALWNSAWSIFRRRIA